MSRLASRCAVFALASLSSASLASAALTFTPVGSPSWTVQDPHLFAAPVGTSSNGYAEFSQTVFSILVPPNHIVHPDLGVGPGTAHSGFNTEMGAGIANLGYVDKTVFNASEFHEPSGIYFTFMMVANGNANGKTPDYDNGPMIPNSVCPLTTSVTIFRGATNVYSETGGPVRSLNAIDPPYAVDGHSHIPNFWTEFIDPVVNGDYEYRFTSRDAAGNGYDWSVPFTIVPEPASLSLLLLSPLASRRRR